ncbi:MAG: Uma2 family endonuclease [Chloroflexota bacterium]|nr:Uma2 family endonuclease [Chloroflexota bacterium]
MATTAETTSTDAARAMTYSDLEQLPEDISQRHEIISGELFVSPSPDLYHQRVSGRLHAWLFDHVTKRGLGEVFSAPTDVKLSEYNVVVPDIAFVSRGRAGITANGQVIDGAPDLVVEIVSPSTRRRDLTHKFALYATAGVQEYWLVDLIAQKLQALTLIDGLYQPIPGDGVPRSRILPDLTIDLDDLFAGLG